MIAAIYMHVTPRKERERLAVPEVRGASSMNETLVLILGSAAIGALLSSAVNGIFSHVAEGRQLARRDLEMALKMAELKHQQLIAAQEWTQKSGRDADVRFFDPLVTVIDYDRGIKEYRKTGRWDKGETAHGRPRP